jgi:hypothetical protein
LMEGPCRSAGKGVLALAFSIDRTRPDLCAASLPTVADL